MKAKRLLMVVFVLAFMLGIVGQNAFASTYHAIDNDALESSGYWNVNLMTTTHTSRQVAFLTVTPGSGNPMDIRRMNTVTTA